jgi:hypothetical protein
VSVFSKFERLPLSPPSGVDVMRNIFALYLYTICRTSQPGPRGET